ncbi:protein FAM200A-like [Lineus longissimus]|uniref:protein FAM200A-like n=1 Tax=Lineus longissimus TaxID=88925 RepID=UPI00315CAA18
MAKQLNLTALWSRKRSADTPAIRHDISVDEPVVAGPSTPTGNDDPEGEEAEGEPVGDDQADTGVEDVVLEDTGKCQCMKCGVSMKVKQSVLKKHYTEKHGDTKDWTKERRRTFIQKWRDDNRKQKGQMNEAFGLKAGQRAASFRLGLMIAKAHLPYNSSEAIVTWASLSDPKSRIFGKEAVKTFPKSRQTVTRRVGDLAEYIRDDNISNIRKSIAWSLMMDESTDKKCFGQAILYERHVDMSAMCVVEAFLAILRVKGSPNHNNLFTLINGFVTDKELPKEKLCGFAADGASVMQSLGRGVAGLLRLNYNENLFIQHCIVHKEVLGTKDGMKNSIPATVEQTIKKVLDFFANSHVRADKLEEIIAMSDEEHEYNQLVRYQAVRWLSLSNCVNRFVSLYTEVAQYFETESTTGKAEVRRICGELYQAVAGGDFELYLLFLQAELKILAKLNATLQVAGQTVFTAYNTISDSIREFIEPIVWDERRQWDDLLSDENLKGFNTDIEFHSAGFHARKAQLVEHGVLTPRMADEVHRNCYKYVLNTAKAIQTRFPELAFVVQNMRFLVPEYRALASLKHCNILAVADRYVPARFEHDQLKEQFRTYRFTSDLDNLLENSPGSDNFFCRLYEMGEFREFAKFCLTLLCLSPTTVACERGFSTMNLIKTVRRCSLSEDNLNALMMVNTDRRDQETFPIVEAMRAAKD